VTFIADLEELVRDHRPHGTMTGDATEPAGNGYLLRDVPVWGGVCAVGHA